jgi:hypothetical protein
MKNNSADAKFLYGEIPDPNVLIGLLILVIERYV